MIRRNIENTLHAALSDTRVVMLNGARQTGKSTLVTDIVRQTGSTYLNLDDAATLGLATMDPRALIKGLKDGAAIDEVQRAPALFPEIKIDVDADPRPGRFLLTGSANVLLLPKVSEYLAGRMEIITLWPFSQGELKGKQERFVDSLFGEGFDSRSAAATIARREIAGLIVAGGYPEAVARKSPGRRGEWFGSYLSTLLGRDVRDLAQIDRIAELPRLLAVLAARCGGLLNMSELSRTTGIPFSTLRRYLGLLQATFVLQLIPAWSTNMSKRLSKSPKIFLIDCGLVSYLNGQMDPAAVETSMQFGHLLENFAVMELRKQLGWSQTRCRMYHYRTSAGREVDILLEDQSGRVAGIEIKASANVRKKDFGGLKSLAENAGDKFVRGVILYLGDAVLHFGEELIAVPINTLWDE